MAFGYSGKWLINSIQQRTGRHAGLHGRGPVDVGKVSAKDANDFANGIWVPMEYSVVRRHKELCLYSALSGASHWNHTVCRATEEHGPPGADD